MEIGRDDVAMLVATRHDGGLVHARFRELPQFLSPGDLLVVNTSATLPAALDARLGGATGRSSGSRRRSRDGTWLVELRTSDRAALLRVRAAGARLDLPGGAYAELLARLRRQRATRPSHDFELDEPLEDYLRRHGRPIRYGYVPEPWPLEAYQTVFALEPGSAEMPSAGRPFTAELVTKLVARGVLVAPDHPAHRRLLARARRAALPGALPAYPAATARLVNAVHGWGGRVIAVGTTVVRALETVADRPTAPCPRAQGWTSLVVTPERGLRASTASSPAGTSANPRTSQLLEAAAGAELLERSYRAALERGYLWHEFGDLHLILP